MKHSLSLALAAFAAVLVLSPALAAEPYGTWVRPSNGAEVSFFNCGGKLCGKVVSKGTSKAKVGTIIVGGAAKTGANEWKGNLLNPEDGKTYSGVITLVGADGLNLKAARLESSARGRPGAECSDANRSSPSRRGAMTMRRIASATLWSCVSVLLIAP